MPTPLVGLFRSFTPRGATARPAPEAGWPPGPAGAQPVIVLSLAATGARPSEGHRLLRIGALRLEGDAEAASFATLARPHRQIPPTATAIHGLDGRAMLKAPEPADAVRALADFAGRAVLVAHGAAFAHALLDAAVRDGAPALRNPWMCTGVLSQWLEPEAAGHGLDAACSRYGIPAVDRKDPLSPARATAALWRALLGHAAARGVVALGDLAAHSRMGAAIAADAENA